MSLSELGLRKVNRPRQTSWLLPIQTFPRGPGLWEGDVQKVEQCFLFPQLGLRTCLSGGSPFALSLTPGTCKLGHHPSQGVCPLEQMDFSYTGPLLPLYRGNIWKAGAYTDSEQFYSHSQDRQRSLVLIPRPCGIWFLIKSFMSRPACFEV